MSASRNACASRQSSNGYARGCARWRRRTAICLRPISNSQRQSAPAQCPGELLISTEEVQAGSEEIKTLNEELQATNEELETLNEELEATVEELHTTNDDLQARGREVQSAAESLEAQRQISDGERERLEAILLSMGDALLVMNDEGRTRPTRPTRGCSAARTPHSRRRTRRGATRGRGDATAARRERRCVHDAVHAGSAGRHAALVRGQRSADPRP